MENFVSTKDSPIIDDVVVYDPMKVIVYVDSTE